jgi:hypothetical protein
MYRVFPYSSPALALTLPSVFHLEAGALEQAGAVPRYAAPSPTTLAPVMRLA